MVDSTGRGQAVVLLSGPIGAGKTTLADALNRNVGFTRLFTRDAILRRMPDTPRTRADLQEAGERLDRETGGRWVVDELRKVAVKDPSSAGIVVDAVFIPEQVEAIRGAALGPVLHVHLTAPRHELETRYASKRGGIKEAHRYSEVLLSATEAKVDELGKVADVVIDTSLTPLKDELDRVKRRLTQATRRPAQRQ